MNYKKFKGYTALIRRDDVNDFPEQIFELKSNGIKIEILEPEAIHTMFDAWALYTMEEVWPKGTVYLIPHKDNLI